MDAENGWSTEGECAAGDSLTRADEALRALRSLPALEGPVADRIREDRRIRFVCASVAIDGGRLTLRETAWILKDGIAPRVGVPVSDLLATLGSAAAFDWALERARLEVPLAVEDFRTVHRLVMLGTLSQGGAGEFRMCRIRIRGSDMRPALPEEISDKVAALLTADRLMRDAHPIVRATRLHAGFLRILPFREGNGRTARVQLALALVRAGYPPALFRADEDGTEYRCGLAESDRTESVGRLTRLIAERTCAEILEELHVARQIKAARFRREGGNGVH